MSGPTKIYLVVVAVLAIVWVSVSTFTGAAGPGLRFISDPDELLSNSNQFTAMLRGRVDVRDAEGAPIAPPEGTLVIDVQARDSEGTLAVRRIGTVQPDGIFEVLGLPYGLATVSVQLGGGQTIWQREDIVVGGAGTLDPRIDPIDLGDELFIFDLEIRGPSGGPASGGRVAWRSVGAEMRLDVLTFDGLAPITGDGRARFLTTSPAIDAVCFVPGARAELFEELYIDSHIDLGPGTAIEIHAEGVLPDPGRWTLRAQLDSIELFPKIEVARGPDGDVPAETIFATFDQGVTSVKVPVARGGRYRLTWGVLDQRRHRFSTIKLASDEDIDVPSEPGTYDVSMTFPIDAFLRKLSRGR